MRYGRVRDIFVAALVEAAARHDEIARVMADLYGSPGRDVAEVRGAARMMRACARDIDECTAQRLAQFFREDGQEAEVAEAPPPAHVVQLADWMEGRLDDPEGAA